MTISSWEGLACPIDHTSPLDLSDPGMLECPACKARYPLEDGIPRMLPPPALREQEEAAQTERERTQRDREASRYDANRMLRALSVAEIPLTLGRLSPGPSDVVVEVGCGTGRVTQQLAARCGQVWALDHSVESLRQAREKVGADTVRFVQADAGFLPLRPCLADRALSCQMLEHLPTASLRERAVAEVARLLRPGGVFVASAYWHSPLTWLAGDKQGFHSGMIYYYRFSRREFRELLSRTFNVEDLTGRLIYILLATSRKRESADTHGTSFPLPGTARPSGRPDTGSRA
jgi:ubiquinone/menaquinone biosynthesis C-methylase UbiE